MIFSIRVISGNHWARTAINRISYGKPAKERWLFFFGWKLFRLKRYKPWTYQPIKDE